MHNLAWRFSHDKGYCRLPHNEPLFLQNIHKLYVTIVFQLPLQVNADEDAHSQLISLLQTDLFTLPSTYRNWHIR
jgi:hypothetical protein